MLIILQYYQTCQILGKIDLKNSRKIGAYYTPLYFAKAISTWAIRSSTDKVLDPSFGGCAFIEAAAQTLGTLGTENPYKSIFGFDVDPIAFDHLSRLTGNYDSEHFLDSDFLKSRNGAQFEVVMGNPPYIKHDHIPKNAMLNARLSTDGVIGNMGRANYWVYFLIHSLSFLKLGGRLAFILPRSFIESDYSRKIRSFLSKKFQNIEIYPIKDQIFDHTSESTVLALFDGYEESSSSCEITIHDNLTAKKICETLIDVNRVRKPSDRNPSRLQSQAEDLLECMALKYATKKLGSFFNVSIGVVTGDKKYFIIGRDDPLSENISKAYLFPVISKANVLDNIVIDKKKIDSLPYLLVIPNGYVVSGENSDDLLDKYINNATIKAKESYHSRHRKPWYSLRNIRPPDAMFKNVVLGCASIYINPSGILCTNNLLSLNAKSEFSLLSTAVFSRTSLFQLSAYVSGRKYGKNAVKFEPTRLKSVLLPYKDLENSYSLEEMSKISELSLEEIDRILLFKEMGFSLKDLKEIRLMLRSYKIMNGFT